MSMDAIESLIESCEARGCFASKVTMYAFFGLRDALVSAMSAWIESEPDFTACRRAWALLHRYAALLAAGLAGCRRYSPRFQQIMASHVASAQSVHRDCRAAVQERVRWCGMLGMWGVSLPPARPEADATGAAIRTLRGLLAD